ncbi:hypothetical protein, partial [Pseudomonas syringae group genomosp. 7]
STTEQARSLDLQKNADRIDAKQEDIDNTETTDNGNPKPQTHNPHNDKKQRHRNTQQSQYDDKHQEPASRT